MIRIIILAALLLTGCAGKGNRATGAANKVAGNEAQLAEKSRELTKGAADALVHAPTNNPPTELAQQFLDKNQQIVGLPLVPYDVVGILTGAKGAVEKLDKRLDALAASLADRQKLEAKLESANAELQDLGRKYETQHKQNVVKKVWRWSIATFGIGGVIALMFFVPAAIPFVARFAAWVVSMFPKLAGLIGVVSTKTVDGIIKGVQGARKKLDDKKLDDGRGAPPVAPAAPAKELLDGELSKNTDQNHKDLILARKESLGLVELTDVPAPR